MKKLAAVLLAVFMLCLLGLCAAASAAEAVTFTVRSWENNAIRETPKTITAYTTVTSGTTAWPGNSSTEETYYYVSEDTTISERITVTGKVGLVLKEGVTLTAQSGINVSAGHSLSIYGEGKVNTKGSRYSAGIGGRDGGAGGTVNIYSGTVTANGGSSGAGIGGGYCGAGGTVTIYGGTVNATGGKYGAGIGGGRAANGGEVNIYGGKVIANGNEWSAGIGGGYGDGGTVTIEGGEVKATGGQYGAGIGGGRSSRNAGTVTISGGMVEANGGLGGAGIGGGDGGGYGEGNGGTVIISGGIVTANGGTHGAGIGGGYYGAGGTVTIEDGTVNANGGDGGAGIGGGDGCISGNGGYGGDGGTVTISGGDVRAEGNAGVGGGMLSDNFGTLTISGGHLRAKSTEESYNGALSLGTSTSGYFRSAEGGSFGSAAPSAMGNYFEFAEKSLVKIAPGVNDQHNLTCSLCKETLWSEDCSGGTATCSAPAMCKVCDELYGDEDKDNHAGEKAYMDNDDGKTHAVYCLDCSELIAQNEPHDFDPDTNLCICQAELKYPVAFMDGDQLLHTVYCAPGKTLGIGGMPVPPVPEGYAFAGFYTKDGLFVHHGMVVNSPMTAYARWHKLEEKRVTAFEGETVKLSVPALDTDVCSWLVNRGDGKGFVPLDETKADYTIEGVKLSESGYRYACYVYREGELLPMSCIFVLEVKTMPADLPETGDASQIGFWLALCAAAAAMALCLRRRRA